MPETKHLDDLDARLINRARSSPRREFLIAAVILTQPGQPDSIITYIDEHGDGDGESMMADKISDIVHTKCLLPDEGLRVQTYRFLLPEEK